MVVDSREALDQVPAANRICIIDPAKADREAHWDHGEAAGRIFESCPGDLPGGPR